MKLRRILYRLVGAIVSVLGLGLIFKFYYSSVLISVGTVILILRSRHLDDGNPGRLQQLY